MEPLTIIIIEDEEAHFTLMNRAIVKKIPHASVYHFKEANDCLKRLDEIKPTVIIADYLLPGMNGIEFLEALNQQDIDIPVIMITGQGDENIAVRTIKLGAKEYLVKSRDAFTLLPSVIEKVVREKKLEQALRESEEKLKESEERYRNLVDNIPIGVSLISSNMEILTLNTQMKKWFPHVDPSKKPLCYRSFNNPPGEKECSFCPTLQTLQDGKVHEAITEIPAGDVIRNYRIISSPIKDVEGKIVTAIEMVDDVTESKQAEKQIRNLSQMLMQAQERERHMISYELHDSIGQNLSTMKISCDTLFDGQSEIPPELSEKRMKLSKLIEQTITAVRNLAYDLRPSGLDEMGLIQAIEIYCEEFYENSGVKVDFQSAGLNFFKLDSNTEIHLYRLIQEGLNNIRKHAAADLAIIRLVGSSPNIILRIEDNGQGFDVKVRELALGSEKRLGLRSMKERVNLFGGQMTVQSLPMNGTKIFIKLPIKEQHNDSEKPHINH